MQSNLAFLGLIKRANAIVSGDRMIEGIRKKNVYCVILTNNASQRTQKVIRNKCAFYNIPIIDSVDTDELQSVIGENVVAIGISNYDMAQKVLKEMRLFYGETDQKRKQEDN
jgi:ribosomal protein L7Ae-like RNA K-turn-binding protein